MMTVERSLLWPAIRDGAVLGDRQGKELNAFLSPSFRAVRALAAVSAQLHQMKKYSKTGQL